MQSLASFLRAGGDVESRLQTLSEESSSFFGFVAKLRRSVSVPSLLSPPHIRPSRCLQLFINLIFFQLLHVSRFHLFRHAFFFWDLLDTREESKGTS